jgi:SAM-dependent methyltransferase
VTSGDLAARPQHPDAYHQDRAATLRNRARLDSNPNLLFWYEQLYCDQFRHFSDVVHLSILEIGSGVSPLSRFYPSVQTSDILDLGYLHHTFDCHEIDRFASIADNSLDVVTLTNVLHHLRSPIEFLTKAAKKLKPGGTLIATEPYFSWLSTPLYKFLHHEPVDFSITTPELQDVRGPLSSANEALPWLIFTRSQWKNEIARHFHFERPIFRPFTSLSYFATGGISHRIPLPRWLYRAFFALDLWASRRFPKVAASFFTVTLTRR